MVKLMFMILGELSSGELTIADSFQKSLPRDNYDVHFILPKKHKMYVSDKEISFLYLDILEGREKNRSIVENYIKNILPSYIILCDAFTVEYSENWSGINLSFLKQYKVPIISLDEYEYSEAGYSIDYYGGINKKLKPLLDQCDYIVKNCPLTMPRSKGEGYFRLFNHIKPLQFAEKIKIKNSIDLKEEEKIIFITTSYWETLNIYRIPALSMLIKWIPKILYNYIEMLNEKVTVIHVGHGEWIERKSKNINYIHYKGLPSEEFEKYLLISDLYITTNIVSITLTKAILGNVPSLVFQNNKLIEFYKLTNRIKEMPLWYREMADEVKVVYPFKASVFGWSNFLTAVLKENPYVKTFEVASMFKVSEAVSALDNLLNNKDSIEKLKKQQIDFIEKYYKVKDSFEVMEEIIEKDKGGEAYFRT